MTSEERLIQYTKIVIGIVGLVLFFMYLNAH